MLFVNEKFCILIEISLKFVPKDGIDNNLQQSLKSWGEEEREGMTHWCCPQFVMTHETCSTCSTLSQIRKDGIIQTSPVVAINRLKDPPTWLKVATTLETPPIPTHWFSIKMSSYQYRKYYCGNKMAIRLSYLHNRISYTGNMTS